MCAKKHGIMWLIHVLNKIKTSNVWNLENCKLLLLTIKKYNSK